MADPTTKTFDQLVEDMAAATQARAAGLVDYSIGSILRALGEAAAGVALWLQGLILVLLRTTRLSTSPDADADTFVADFGAAPQAGDETYFARLPATFATTQQTFSRVSTGGQVIIQNGAQVQTQDGSQQFVVIADETNAAYSAAVEGYVLADGFPSVTVTIQALTAGSAANVLAGMINTIASAIPGISSTTNASAVTNGFDAETTPAMRPRFRKFFNTREKGTPLSLEYAIEALQRGVVCVPVENTHYDGTTEKGFTTLIVDDGSGNPPSSLLTAAGAAADAYHAAGTSFGVYAPTILDINVIATLVTASGANHSAAVAAAVSAISAYLNTRPIGGTVYWSRVWQILQDASEDIVEVTGLTVNGGTADVTATFVQVAKAGTISIL